ncbi:MAG: ThaI family type II restriction endonuclease [Desulfobaccales bacterium]
MGDNKLLEIFGDGILIHKIQNRLPSLFQLAEQESARAGKIGMEVGSVREKIIIALLIYKFGINNVDTNIPITEKEVDVRLFNNPISIKTITGKSLSGIKMIWTVDALSAKEFSKNYTPLCDIILIKINWNEMGSFYYIPREAQVRWFNILGNEVYIKLPKEGTNPRGVELSKTAVNSLINDKSTRKIDIFWKKSPIKYNLYQRWIELWEKD